MFNALLFILITYTVLFFILPLVLFPFTHKKPLPTRLPREYTEQIAQLESQSNTKFEYLKNTYELILSQNHGGRFKSILYFSRAFDTDLRSIFHRTGFMHTSQLNHFLRVLLAKSSFFSDDDIRLKTVLLNFLPHQFIQVRIAGQWYAVDLWANSCGVPLGRYAVGFR